MILLLEIIKIFLNKCLCQHTILVLYTYNFLNLICTHFVGGALTQMLTFALAGSKLAADLPKPIVAISYASPRVGDKGYLAKFKQLEKKGMLRHIRVSNEGDIVAVSPSAGFYQTGLNLHVAPGKQVEIGYCKDRSIWSQLNVSALANHGLPT